MQTSNLPFRISIALLALSTIVVSTAHSKSPLKTTETKWLTANVRTDMQHPDSTAPKQLTAEERTKAIALYNSSASGVAAAIKGLTPAQLTFKAAPDKWSIQECVQHIAASETNLWAMVESGLQQPANPDKRAGIKVTDDALVSAVEDRSKKNVTFAALEPKNSTFTATADALTAFDAARAKHISFLQSTDADLRNHVLELPLGTFDTYQFILLVGAHTQRHTQQIEEVKASAGYPK